MDKLKTLNGKTGDDMDRLFTKGQCLSLLVILTMHRIQLWEAGAW